MRPRILRLSPPGGQLATTVTALPLRRLTTSARLDARANTSSSSSSSSRFRLPPDYVPAKQPPSAKPTDTRKAQLIRTYTSLLRTAPLMLIFQHNNLDAAEWASVRRELRAGIGATPVPAGVDEAEFRAAIRLQVVRTSMLKLAMRIHEFFDPAEAAREPAVERSARHGPLVHDLSSAARRAVKSAEERELVRDPNTAYAALSPLLIGPICLLTFPVVSPAHLDAALRILAPVAGRFPQPTRRKRPEYYDPHVQTALPKLLLMGGRADARLMDALGIHWVAGIDGGIDGLRGQLVNMLQGAGMGVVNALEGASKQLWFTLEGRKSMLEGDGGEMGVEVEGEAVAEAEVETAPGGGGVLSGAARTEGG